MAEPAGLAIGQVRRQVLLGSEAIYRVRDWNDQVVEVEVISAPGLSPRQLFTFDRAAVLAMSVVRLDEDGR